VRDVSIPTVEVLRTILSHIEAEVTAGRPVYVHCLGGVGRTGTVAGCLLVENGASGDEALAMVSSLFETMSPEKVHRHRHDGSPQTEQQRQFVRAWNDGRSG
jgi:protein-tyrosine phosphatase